MGRRVQVSCPKIEPRSESPEKSKCQPTSQLAQVVSLSSAGGRRAIQATKPGVGGGGGFDSIFRGFGAMLQGGQRAPVPAPSAAADDLPDPVIDGFEVRVSPSVPAAERRF